jgi:hypothetical protein
MDHSFLLFSNHLFMTYYIKKTPPKKERKEIDQPIKRFDTSRDRGPLQVYIGVGRVIKGQSSQSAQSLRSDSFAASTDFHLSIRVPKKLSGKAEERKMKNRKRDFIPRSSNKTISIATGWDDGVQTMSLGEKAILTINS